MRVEYGAKICVLNVNNKRFYFSLYIICINIDLRTPINSF
jgi:hypothetical protein